MSDDASSLVREMDETAKALRRLVESGGGATHESVRLVAVLASSFPRRIRRIGANRRDTWRRWQSLVLSFDPRKLPFGSGLRLRLWRWRLVKLPRIVETLAFHLGVMALFRRLNKGAKRVLTFHNVLPDSLCTYDLASGVTLPASCFENLVACLKKRYRFSSDFNDPSTLTITFDDGYRCQFETAGEILSRLGVPGVVFVSGNVWEADAPVKSLVVDRLLYWASYAPLSALSEFAGAKVESRTAFWHDVMDPAYRLDAEARGETVFARADALWPFEKIVASLDPAMVRLRLTGPDRSRVDELRRSGWKVGWHTQSHFPLARLSDEDAERELTPADSSCLEVPMSFPYGEPDSVSAREEKIARAKGYPGAYSNLSFCNDREGDFFRLRFSPTGDKVEDEAMLSGFRYFMECGRLWGRPYGAQRAEGKEVRK